MAFSQKRSLRGRLNGNARYFSPTRDCVFFNLATNGTRYLDGKVMIRAMMFSIAIQRSSRILVKVLGGIPALIAKVDPAAEGDLSVDQANFFVVRSAKRMTVVEDEMDARMDPVPDTALPVLALKRIEVGMIPHQEVDVQLRAFVDETKDFLFEGFGPESRPWERQAGVDLPTCKKDLIAGGLKYLGDSFVIGSGFPDFFPAAGMGSDKIGATREAIIRHALFEKSNCRANPIE